MKSYLNYFKLRVITNLQYRASALAGIMTQLFFGLVYIMMYLAFYESNDTSNVMNWNQLVTYMWLQQAFFALTYPFIKNSISSLVNSSPKRFLFIISTMFILSPILIISNIFTK